MSQNSTTPTPNAPSRSSTPTLQLLSTHPCRRHPRPLPAPHQPPIQYRRFPSKFHGGLRKTRKINKLVACPNGPTWTRSLANKFGKPCKGIGKTRPKVDRIKGTGTMFFTKKDKIPKDRKITYANFICNIRPQKSETHRVRLTAGGNKLDYPGDPSSPAVSLLNVKIHINKNISRIKKQRKIHVN